MCIVKNISALQQIQRNGVENTNIIENCCALKPANSLQITHKRMATYAR